MLDALSALPFVNWIFWATLTSGTLLVVGGTEMLGGTTRGYRLFMAGLLVVCAAILLLSELNLAPGTVADETAGIRRSVVWVVGGLTLAYLVARSRGCRAACWRSPPEPPGSSPSRPSPPQAGRSPHRSSRPS